MGSVDIFRNPCTFLKRPRRRVIHDAQRVFGRSTIRLRKAATIRWSPNSSSLLSVSVNSGSALGLQVSDTHDVTREEVEFVKVETKAPA
jgi:hypothetical protein